MDDRFTSRRVPRDVMGLHLAALGACCAAALLVVVPFWPWIVVALWASGLASGLQRPITRLVSGRRRAAALVTLALVVAITVPVVVTAAPLFGEASTLWRRLLGANDTRRMLETLVSGDGADVSGLPFYESLARFIGSHGGRAWEILRAVAGATGHVVAGAAVFVLVAYVRLAHGRAVAAWTIVHVPVDRRWLARLWRAFSETGRGLLVGFGGAGIAQSVIAVLLYAAIGVPHPLVLGVLTLLSAIVPGVGTAVIWLPVAAGLVLTGRLGTALLVTAVGAGVIGTIDNVLKPILARYGRFDLPSSLVFVSMLGGFFAVGPSGFLLGPIVVRLAKELLAIARDDRAVRRPSAS